MDIATSSGRTSIIELISSSRCDGRIRSNATPRSSYYLTVSLTVAAHKFQAAKSLRSSAGKSARNEFSICCEALLDWKWTDRIRHQSGYRASSASSLNCSTCSGILFSLDDCKPSEVRQFEVSEELKIPTSEGQNDSIEVVDLTWRPILSAFEYPKFSASSRAMVLP